MKIILLLLLFMLLAACTNNNVTQDSEPETIVSIGPSNTEILIELGFANNLIGVDEWSVGIPGLPDDLELFDMLHPDSERLLLLNPDIIITTDMAGEGGSDPLALVELAGTTVIRISSGDSVEAIQQDILLIADTVNARAAGERIVNSMNSEIERIKNISESITERRTVYFEIEPPPFIFSIGSNTFINDLIEIAGGINIFADFDAWISVADEQVLSRNPDVIITNASWAEDPTGNIINRTGWHIISAVSNNRVSLIDADASSQPTHNIIQALIEIAYAIYPEYFGQ